MFISIDDFKKIEIKIGLILSAEKVPKTDKLLKLSVDLGLKPHSGSPDHSALQNGLGESFFSLLETSENVAPGSMVK